MPEWIVYSIGFSAQLMFSARTIYQWLASEKKRKVIAPRFFWQMSLFASFFLFVYGYLREDFAIMLGQTITYFIYIRNIQLIGSWKKFPLFSRYFFFAVPLLIVLYSATNDQNDIEKLLITHNIATWLFIMGTFAQVLFTFRFIYQWVCSERRRISFLPMGFWLISLSGSLLILTYGIFRKDPVLIAGHLFGSVVYIRNILIISKNG